MNDYTADYDYLIKVVMVGDSGVGKTSLMQRFKENAFHGHHIATIGVDFEVKTIQLGDKVAKLQMWDTAGQERFRNITSSYYRGAHSIALVLDVTQPMDQTRHSLVKWMQEIRKYAQDDVQVMLVANKTDIKRHRKISSPQLQAIADELNLPLIETSARNAHNVQAAFTQCAQRYIECMGSERLGDLRAMDDVKRLKLSGTKLKGDSSLFCCKIL